MAQQEDRSQRDTLSPKDIDFLSQKGIDLTSVRHPSLNRKSINDLRMSGAHDVPSYLAVLATTNENNRETALKALGEVGGDLAISAIELTLLKKSDERWIAKKAAANSLREQGLLTSEGTPLINPAAVNKEFVKLDVVYRPGKDSGLKTSSPKDYAAATRIKAAKPSEIQSLELKIKGNLDTELLAKRAKKAGLLIAETESGIRVMGDTWPGMGKTNPHLSLTFSSSKKGVISIQSATIPADVAEDWSTCIRVLTRLGKWASQ